MSNERSPQAGDRTTVHTLGPWHPVDLRHQKGGQIRIFQNNVPKEQRNNAILANVLRSNPNADADARLIAAAPDLLEACKLALGYIYVDRHEVRGVITAAISKAERAHE